MSVAAADVATLMAEIEIEMMSDMYNKITSTCLKKCISSKYRESDLSKGEAVCLVRCAAKWIQVHENIGQKLVASDISKQ